MTDRIIQSPIVEELRNRVTELREAIRITLDEWYCLQNIKRPKILSEYDKLFGELEIEIQRKTLESSEIGRRVELLTLKKDRGEKLTKDLIILINTLVDKEFAQFHKRINESLLMSEQERHHSATQDYNQSNNNELPKLYRAIVKKLHPDISTQDRDFSKYWQSVQEAYQTKNLQKIRSLYMLICDENEQFQSLDTNSVSDESQLLNIIKGLEIQLERENRKLKRLKQDEPFTIEINLQNTHWIEQHRQKLNNEIFKKRAEIKQFKLL